MNKITFTETFKPTLIYVFSIEDEAHRDCLKIGETTLGNFDKGQKYPPQCETLNKVARHRIDQYTKTAGVAYRLLYTELTLYTDTLGRECGFHDKEIHQILKRSGIKKKTFQGVKGANEWYCCTLETIKKAIKARKEDRKSLINSEVVSDSIEPIIFRPSQRDAIDRTVTHFREAKRLKEEGQKNYSRKMLWNAKMRFGKTLATLQVVKEMDFGRTLIMTHRPAVEDGWFEDFQKIFAESDKCYRYGSKTKGETLDTLNHLAQKEQIHYVYFASIQDLRGSEEVGGDFDKNEEVFRNKWDFIIIDEAHEGIQTEIGQELLNAFKKKKAYELYLSGTPFNIKDDFEEQETYTWDYIDEQLAKKEWDEEHKGEPNPYASLPTLNIYTYDLSSLLFDQFIDPSSRYFKFSEFFRTDDEGNFVYETDVDRFLDLLCRDDEEALYPFSNEYFRSLFRHTLWKVPGTKEAKALSVKLKKHEVYSQFRIVNVAGDGDEEEENRNALDLVNKAIGEDSEATRTITITCGRLTTGVTVPAWTGVFLLSGGDSVAVAGYMQTIFRVQSPHFVHGRMKTDCFAFDFAPDRTLRLATEMLKVSQKAGEQDQADRQKLEQLLIFCPIIAYKGSKMVQYNVNKMLQEIKRIQIVEVVNRGFEDSNLYNDELLQLSQIDLNLFNGLHRLIGTTSKSSKKDIVINKQGLNKEENGTRKKVERKKKEDLTPEELALLEKTKELRKQKETAISILRGISIRMPLMLYGADIDDEEKELTIDNFTALVDDESWSEFMPRGVTKKTFEPFKKFYDPDIFQGAGQRIREMTRQADTLSIEKRIERLAQIFSTFRNPDKETVLTPWRVVNMHLAEAFGGYSFYDRKYEFPLKLPVERKIKDITDTLFQPDQKILEINSKTGLYPLYACYTIYRRRVQLSHEDYRTLDLEKALAHWDRCLDENIFVLCKTKMAQSITRRTLVGFRGVKTHTIYFQKFIDTLLKDKKLVINILKTPIYWKINSAHTMKFDAIIGNPPYQVATENSRSNPIYNHFIDLSIQLAPQVSLITPARYLFGVGMTPTEWNEKVLNDPHYRVVWYRANSQEVFPSADIKGGVAVMYYNANKNFGAMEYFTAFRELNSLSYKVRAKNEKKITEIIFAESSYRFNTSLAEVDKLVTERLNADRKVISNVFEKIPDLFTEEKKEGDVGFYGRIKGNRCYRYIDRCYIEEHPNLEKWKVFVPESNGSGAIGEVLSTPLIGEPLIGATQTFLSIGAFDSREEAVACLKYIKTKFARTLLGILKATQHNPKNTWRLIPLQDFTSASDIDWSQSVADIDRHLYQKYELSEEEIAFIEEKVRPME